MNYYQPYPPYYNGGYAYQPLPPYQPYMQQDYSQELFDQQSYIENILRDNINKVATVYMNFENSQWGSKVFKGYIKGAGKDHIILKDLQSETRYLLLMVYLSYITFDERIEYDYQYRKKENE